MPESEKSSRATVVALQLVNRKFCQRKRDLYNQVGCHIKLFKYIYKLVVNAAASSYWINSEN